MLTVKWIVNTPQGEIIRIFEARTVDLAFRVPPPPGNKHYDARPSPPPDPGVRSKWTVAGRSVEHALCILDANAGLEGRSLDCGTVYVMNDNGSTVGKYVLSTEMVDMPESLSD